MSGALPPDDLPRSPSGHVPQWVVDEASGKKVEPVPFRGAPNPLLTSGSTVRRRRRAARWRTAGAVVIVAAVIGAAFWAFGQPVGSAPPVAAAPARDGFPTPGVDEGERPAGRTVVGPIGASRTFRFLDHQQDSSTPVTWSPCRPIHWVVRPTNAPPGGQAMLDKAFARVAAATGLTFVADGTTDEGWAEDREAFQPERYGDRWAPVLVVWASSSEVPDFGVDVAGEAGPYRIRTQSGDTVFVSGAVALSAAEFRRASTPKQKATAEAIVLHELGHLVGLAHVDDKKQVMFPRAQSGVTDYGPGDLTGLGALGRGPCRPDV
jgi:hypothetical protein